MNPIESVFRGYRFRSRLEARWAVFFEEMGLNWEYEPEGFVLDDGQMYLPDFRVTSPDGIWQWYEIKPESNESDEKFSAFVRTLRQSILDGTDTYQSAELLHGDPAQFFSNYWTNGGVCPRCGEIRREFEAGILETDEQFGIGCITCDIHTPCGGDHPWEKGMFMDVTPHKGYVMVDRGDWRGFKMRLMNAAQKARSARFEHGERKSMASI